MVGIYQQCYRRAAEGCQWHKVLSTAAGHSAAPAAKYYSAHREPRNNKIEIIHRQEYIKERCKIANFQYNQMLTANFYYAK